MMRLLAALCCTNWLTSHHHRISLNCNPPLVFKQTSTLESLLCLVTNVPGVAFDCPQAGFGTEFVRVRVCPPKQDGKEYHCHTLSHFLISRLSKLTARL
jgi:hypothetical protein